MKMRKIPLRLWLLSLASALLQFLPFPIAGPAPLWRRIFCWFCLVPLLQAMLGRDRSGNLLKPSQTALLGYLCGIVWYMGNCYWIYRTMHVYESIPAIASFGILLLFALYVGLYHAVFGVVVGALHRKYSRTVVLFSVPFIWVAVELARARITGFPWDLLGYTQVDNLTLSRLAAVTGVMGISFVIALANALWLVRIHVKSRHALYLGVAAAAIISISATIATISVHPNTPSPTQAVATLLQENLGVGNEASSSPETKQQLLTSFTELSLHPTVVIPSVGNELNALPVHASLIAWPEAPTPFVDSDPIFRTALSNVAVRANAPVVANAISFGPVNSDGHYSLYNSASFFLANGAYDGHYDKMHLVPFGEYTPYKPLFFFVGHLLDDLVFIPGTQRRLFEVGNKRYGVFICYESIFGDDMRQFAREGAQVLVNISDDGWYGDTSAPWEHLDMVRMRAIENHRWVIRATNTGITAAIDPLGRVTATLPRHIRASIQVAFGYDQNQTFYTLHGDWFAWICSFTTILLLFIAYARKRFTLRTEVN
jgi:apolipoprotein N-acyltransferase